MLIVSLGISGLLILIAVMTKACSRRPDAWTLGLGVGLVFLPCACMGAFWAPMLQLALMYPALLLCVQRCLGLAWYSLACVCPALCAYAVTGAFAYSSMSEYDRLREQFPYESMATRVPEPTNDEALLSADSGTNLLQLEERIDDGWRYSRVRYLRQIHEEQVALFVSSPGFGVGRIFRPNESNLKRRDYTAGRESQPQPGKPSDVEWSPGDVLPDGVKDVAGLREAHLANIVDFVDPEGFGYIKDRQHVAGSTPHTFRVSVRSPEKLRVATVELVSLLLHEQPAVYVSPNLPRMEEARELPTRKLDSFEEYGLKKLRGGEDLIVGQADKETRVLGALRAAKQCVGCHGGQRGDLLGAFTYTLRDAEEQSK